MDYNLQKQHYENLWKKVGLWKNESPHFKTRIPQQETIDFIDFLKQKGITKGKALDVGCGGGRHVILFAKHGFQSYGIDFSKTAIKLAKIDAGQKKVKVNLKVGDFLKADYPKESFDVIHDTGLFHHLRKKERNVYLKKILKILKKDGYYKLFEFSINTKYLTGHKISRQRNWIIHNNHYTHFFTKKEIKDFFEKHFKILKVIDEKRKEGFRAFYIFYAQKR